MHSAVEAIKNGVTKCAAVHFGTPKMTVSARIIDTVGYRPRITTAMKKISQRFL